MTTESVTLQSIMGDSSRASRLIARRRGILPLASTALDPLTRSILEAASSGRVKGSRLAAAALSEENLRVSAEQAYLWACQLASPRITRHPLLKSDQVQLPDPPTNMWEAEFEVTATGRMVLEGRLPGCLLNGLDSQESKMPPLKTSSLSRVFSLLSGTPSDGELEALMSEPDFASPCVVELAGHENWSHTGRGWLSLNASVEAEGQTVRVHMIPQQWSHEAALEKVTAVVEDVPGVKECYAVRSRTGTGYEVEIQCRNDASSSSATEALLASSPLKVRQKVSYMVFGASGERESSSPVEIARAFFSNALQTGISHLEIMAALDGLEGAPRCVSRKTGSSAALGPYVVWAMDGSGRNRTMPLTAIRRQAPGGKGTSLGSDQLKLAVCARTRSRAAVVGMFGSASSVDVRAPDSHQGWMHPAETLPQGAASPVLMCVPSGKNQVVLTTSMGMVKKMAAHSLCGSRRGTRQAMKLEPGDVPVSAAPCEEGDDILLVTSAGQAIRFQSAKLREAGPSSRGVSGISLRDGDRVASVLSLPSSSTRDIVAVYSDGTASRLSPESIATQNRGGAGISAFAVEDPTKIVAAVSAAPDEEILICRADAWSIRFKAGDLPLGERPATPVQAMSTANSAIVCACVVPSEEERLSDPEESGDPAATETSEADQENGEGCENE